MFRSILGAALTMLLVGAFGLANAAQAKECASVKKAADCKDGCSWDKKKNSCSAAAKAAGKTKDSAKKDKAAAAKPKKAEPAAAAKAKKAEPAAKAEPAKTETPAEAPQNEESVPAEEDPTAEEDF